MLPGQHYTQNILTIPAGGRVSFDVGFTPTSWIIFPKDPITTGDYIYVAVQKQFSETGLPLSGTGQLTLPGLGGDTVYIRNTGGADVDVYIVASRGILPTSITMPLTVEGLTIPLPLIDFEPGARGSIIRRELIDTP